MTHPFHVLHGLEFELLDLRCAWGEERVYFRDGAGRLRRLPAAWTSVGMPTAFADLSGGRSHFQVEELLQLVALIERLDKVAMAEALQRKDQKVSSK